MMTVRAKTLTQEQLNRVLQVEASDVRRKHRMRNMLMLVMTHKAGLRAQEVAYTEHADITDLDGRVAASLHVTKRAAKSGKERHVPLIPELKQLFELYLKTTGIESGPLFYNQYGRPMSPNATQKELGRMYKRAEFRNASSHSGRRSFITRLACEAALVGANLRDVQKLAGHADIRTTEIYLSSSGREVDLVNRLSSEPRPQA